MIETTNINYKIKEGFRILQQIKDLYEKFNKVTKTKMPPYFEDKYGEYLVGNKIIEAGISIEQFNKKGFDILANGKRIEIKTSRSVKRFPGALETGFGWPVKLSQWKKKTYDFLVCVAFGRKEPNLLIFTYDETRNLFTKASWEWEKFRQKKAKNFLVLDLFVGGLKVLEAHRRLAKKKIKWVGK